MQVPWLHLNTGGKVSVILEPVEWDKMFNFSAFLLFFKLCRLKIKKLVVCRVHALFFSVLTGASSPNFQTLDLKRTIANTAKSAMLNIPIPNDSMGSLDIPR